MTLDPTDRCLSAVSAVQPVELRAGSTFQFRCHPGIACFNACCKNIDITLTPYDILRLKRHFGMTSKEFVAEYTIPFEMDADGMPGLKLRTKPETTECAFLGERDCTVYDERSVACRYYALGNMGIRRKDETKVEDIYFVVREAHCLGHEESCRQTVAEYRAEQGIERYDEMNRAWRDIVLKKRSSGPTVGAPSARSLQLFDMCSYDLDGFLAFIHSDGFRDVFDADDAVLEELARDEDKLLAFSMRFLNQVLFGAETIPIRQGARERRIRKRKAVWAARRRDAAARHREDLEKQQYGE